MQLTKKLARKILWKELTELKQQCLLLKGLHQRYKKDLNNYKARISQLEEKLKEKTEA